MGASSSRLEPALLQPKAVLREQRVNLKKIQHLVSTGKLAPFYTATEDEDQDECPICFHNYPAVNFFKCCKKPICSECYVQIRSACDTSHACCPFCKAVDCRVKFRIRTKQEKMERRLEAQEVEAARIRARQRQDDDYKAEASRREQAVLKSSLDPYSVKPPRPICRHSARDYRSKRAGTASGSRDHRSSSAGSRSTTSPRNEPSRVQRPSWNDPGEVTKAVSPRADSSPGGHGLANNMVNAMANDMLHDGPRQFSGRGVPSDLLALDLPDDELEELMMERAMTVSCTEYRQSALHFRSGNSTPSSPQLHTLLAPQHSSPCDADDSFVALDCLEVREFPASQSPSHASPPVINSVTVASPLVIDPVTVSTPLPLQLRPQQESASPSTHPLPADSQHPTLVPINISTLTTSSASASMYDASLRPESVVYFDPVDSLLSSPRSTFTQPTPSTSKQAITKPWSPTPHPDTGTLADSFVHGHCCPRDADEEGAMLAAGLAMSKLQHPSFHTFNSKPPTALLSPASTSLACALAQEAADLEFAIVLAIDQAQAPSTSSMMAPLPHSFSSETSYN